MKEIFYSNGIDTFGPVSFEEFCKNRYYKSTLIWYEGLSSWVLIGDCEELKHLIGTISTPVLDNSTPQSLPNLTPPLVKTENSKIPHSNNRYVVIAVVLFILAIVLIAYNYNTSPQTITDVSSNDSSIVEETTETMITDSTEIREKELARKVALETEKKTYRINWDKFISASTNDYKQKEIGGIDDLKVLIRNNSPYKIDNARVKVSYVKANGDSYQTETMEFDNILPNSSKELFAPKSDRGVKVICSLLSVKSSAMNFCYDTKYKAKNKNIEDPYLCKLAE